MNRVEIIIFIIIICILILIPLGWFAYNMIKKSKSIVKYPTFSIRGEIHKDNQVVKLINIKDNTKTNLFKDKYVNINRFYLSIVSQNKEKIIDIIKKILNKEISIDDKLIEIGIINGKKEEIYEVCFNSYDGKKLIFTMLYSKSVGEIQEKNINSNKIQKIFKIKPMKKFTDLHKFVDKVYYQIINHNYKYMTYINIKIKNYKNYPIFLSDTNINALYDKISNIIRIRYHNSFVLENKKDGSFTLIRLFKTNWSSWFLLLLNFFIIGRIKDQNVNNAYFSWTLLYIILKKKIDKIDKTKINDIIKTNELLNCISKKHKKNILILNSDKDAKIIKNYRRYIYLLMKRNEYNLEPEYISTFNYKNSKYTFPLISLKVNFINKKTDRDIANISSNFWDDISNISNFKYTLLAKKFIKSIKNFQETKFIIIDFSLFISSKKIFLTYLKKYHKNTIPLFSNYEKYSERIFFSALKEIRDKKIKFGLYNYKNINSYNYIETFNKTIKPQYIFIDAFIIKKSFNDPYIFNKVFCFIKLYEGKEIDIFISGCDNDDTIIKYCNKDIFKFTNEIQKSWSNEYDKNKTRILPKNLIIINKLKS